MPYEVRKQGQFFQVKNKITGHTVASHTSQDRAEALAFSLQGAQERPKNSSEKKKPGKKPEKRIIHLM